MHEGFWFLFALSVLVLIAVLFFVWRKKLAPKLFEPDFSKVQFVKVAGLKICYRQSGKGQDLVLVHGIGASSFIWRNVFADLSRNYKVTCVDLAGFGLSDKDPLLDYDLDSQSERLHSILSALGIETATLVGSSMGGNICLNLMKYYPHIYLKTIAIAPAADKKLVSLPAKLAAPSFALFGFMLNHRSMKMILKRMSSKKDLITDHVVSEYLKPFNDKGTAVKVFSKALKSIHDQRLPALFVDIKNPVLILWGKGDVLVPEETIWKLQTVIANSKVVVHDSAGHHPFEDEPEWVLSEIRKFV